MEHLPVKFNDLAGSILADHRPRNGNKLANYNNNDNGRNETLFGMNLLQPSSNNTTRRKMIPAENGIYLNNDNDNIEYDYELNHNQNNNINRQYSLALNESIKLKCDVESNPIAERFYWTLNTDWLDESKIIAQMERDNVLLYQTKTLDNYGKKNGIAKRKNGKKGKRSKQQQPGT